MLSECTWTNSLLEMELWTTLAQLGLKHKNHEMVILIFLIATDAWI